MENFILISILFTHLLKSCYVFSKKASVIKCECVAVESLLEAENVLYSRRLYIIDGDKKYCKLCKSQLREFKEAVYMFKFPPNIPIKRIFPNFYIKEIKSLIARFSKYNFLISRSRPTALSVDFGEKVFIDLDFA